MKRLLRLYPSAWRARYEAEVADLLDKLPTERSVALDLIHGALVERARALWRVKPAIQIPDGGPPMLEHPLQRHPTGLALLALLLVAPTFLSVLVALLAYQMKVPGLAPLVEPVIDTLTAWRWVQLFLLGAPFPAFVVAVVPLVGLGWGRTNGGLRLTITLRARALNLVVLTLCVLLGGLLAGDLERGFLFEATR